MEGLDNKQYPTGNGVCNGTDDVVEEINRDFPDATPRQIRDAIIRIS